jgi:hypothetical protein
MAVWAKKEEVLDGIDGRGSNDAVSSMLKELKVTMLI